MSDNQTSSSRIMRKISSFKLTRHSVVEAHQPAQPVNRHATQPDTGASQVSGTDTSNNAMTRRHTFAAFTDSRMSDSDAHCRSSNGRPSVVRRYTSSYYELSRKHTTDRHSNGGSRITVKKSYVCKDTEKIVMVRD